MGGCEVYQIEPLETFEISFEKLIKNHYRKNIRARNSFEDLVDNFITELRINPSSNLLSEDIGFPKGSYKSEYKFRKIEFNTPELSGSSGCGRFMYVVCESNCTVYLMWIYTHKEFRKRPSDDDLRRGFVMIEQNLGENQT